MNVSSRFSEENMTSKKTSRPYSPAKLNVKVEEEDVQVEPVSAAPYAPQRNSNPTMLSPLPIQKLISTDSAGHKTHDKEQKRPSRQNTYLTANDNFGTSFDSDSDYSRRSKARSKRLANLTGERNRASEKTQD